MNDSEDSPPTKRNKIDNLSVPMIPDDEDDNLTYEQIREKNVRENEELYNLLGINEAVQDLADCLKTSEKIVKDIKKKPLPKNVLTPTRRSMRLADLPVFEVPLTILNNSIELRSLRVNMNDDMKIIDSESSTHEVNIEQLIMIVRNHSIIYDITHPEFKNTRKKNFIWNNIISPEMNGEKGEALKSKWENLIDSFQKYLSTNKTTTRQALGSSEGNYLDLYKNWKWAKNLEFLRPHLSLATTMSNVFQRDDTVETYNHGHGSSEEHLENEDTLGDGLVKDTNQTSQIRNPQNQKKEKEPTLSNIDEVLENINKKPKTTPSALDAVDMLMMSHAKTIKTFSARRQAIAKKQISEIVGNLEIEQTEENEYNH